MNTFVRAAPRPLLLIAHPGHELRLFGWLRQTQPLIVILTDGSGSTGSSRIGLSENLVANVGGEIVMPGHFSEPMLYEIIRHQRAEALVEVAAQIAHIIDREGSQVVVSDAAEGYHPGHDLCSPLLASAVARSAQHGSIRHREYLVVGDPRHGNGADGVLALDDATLADKISHSRNYAAASGDVLSQEVQSMFDTYGEEAFRYEGLFPAGSQAPQLHNGLRYYELRGEERVREGRYSEVLRHQTHVAPLEAALHISLH